MHYPSDVVAGALFGLLIGGLVPGVGERTLEERMAEFVADLSDAAVRRQAEATVGSEPATGSDDRSQTPRRVKVGIVGLPNAGKSTLFNALTQGGAETGDYPFTTIDPNVAVVGVPDERLEAVAETVGSSKVVLETIEFHDIAGLVRGASEGEGLGNRFLAAIRETDAICHVVRTHAAERCAPSRGPGRSARRHRADRARAPGSRPRSGAAPARAGDQAGSLARQGAGRRARLARAVVRRSRTGARCAKFPPRPDAAHAPRLLAP